MCNVRRPRLELRQPGSGVLWPRRVLLVLLCALASSGPLGRPGARAQGPTLGSCDAHFEACQRVPVTPHPSQPALNPRQPRADIAPLFRMTLSVPAGAVDMLRKLLLTSLILFVDTEYGSSKLLRLVLAAIVTVLYLAVLALARPFKHAEDLYLACTANLLLACAFISGIAIKLCGEEWDHVVECKALVGLSSSYQTNVFVVVLTIVMLVVSLLVILYKVLTEVTPSTIRLVSSEREPVLGELPPGCNFHGFLSHTWRTGQDQTHTIARQLKL
eukprot:2486494-Rhodomonas_salina.1